MYLRHHLHKAATVGRASAVRRNVRFSPKRDLYGRRDQRSRLCDGRDQRSRLCDGRDQRSRLCGRTQPQTNTQFTANSTVLPLGGRPLGRLRKGDQGSQCQEEFEQTDDHRMKGGPLGTVFHSPAAHPLPSMASKPPVAVRVSGRRRHGRRPFGGQPDQSDQNQQQPNDQSHVPSPRQTSQPNVLREETARRETFVPARLQSAGRSRRFVESQHTTRCMEKTYSDQPAVRRRPSRGVSSPSRRQPGCVLPTRRDAGNGAPTKARRPATISVCSTDGCGVVFS